MGGAVRMITDVFSLFHVGAEELRWADRPQDRYPCVRGHAIGPKELARLGEVLGAGPAETLLAGFSFLAGESQEPPWVVAVPAEITGRVAAIDGDRMAEIVDGWAVPGGGDYLDELKRYVTSREGPFVLYISSLEP